jgi:Flp pilus assembly protein protease CpaA
MTLGVLVLLVFVAVTVGVFAVFMLFSGRSQVQREKAIQDRLQEAGGTAVAAARCC